MGNVTEDSELTTEDEAVDWPPADGEAVLVAERGVRVRKWVTERGSTVPVVNYDIASMRDETVVLELHDETPEDLSRDDVGFHDEYEAENWRRIGENGLLFRRRFEPGESVTTVYGVRRSTLDDTGAFLSRPVVTVSSVADADMSEAGEAVETLDLGGDDPTVDDLLDDVDDSDGVDDTDAAGDTDDERPLERFDLGGTDEATTDRRGPESGDSTADGTVADELAREFHEDVVSPETRDRLTRELNLELSESTAAFLDRVRGRTDQQRARLERDIDELERSITELYGLKADAGDLHETRVELDDHGDELDAIEAAVEALEDAKAEATRLDRAIERLDDLESVAATDDRVDGIEAELDELDEVAARADDLDALEDEVADLDRRAASIRGLAEAERDLARLDEAAARLEALDALETDVESLREERESETASLQASIDELDDGQQSLVERLDETSMRLSDDLDAVRREREAATADLRDDLAADIETAQSDLESDLETVRDDLDAEVSALERRTTEDVEAIDRQLESEYVTEADIDAAIVRRVDNSLQALVFLAVGTGGILLSLVLAATGAPSMALSSFVLGGVLLGGWWYLQPGDLDLHGSDEPDAASVDEALGLDDESDAPELEPADVDDSGDDEAVDADDDEASGAADAGANGGGSETVSIDDDEAAAGGDDEAKADDEAAAEASDNEVTAGDENEAGDEN
ncbi:hypothetical protein [Haloarchaeobius sp. TZWWS8]|uniref:hypothetical protein n=1 Tax=Haloarchaeobius sp. TZWWS8 TaxID=3446121 RepID=UPI003EBB38C4